MLVWGEFIGIPTPEDLQKMQSVAAGASGKSVGMAQIRSGFSVNFGGKPPGEPVLEPVPGSPQSFALADRISVTVTFDPLHSWKRIDPLTAAGEQFLLDHEQGHYNISALMARDCFIDLMQLKSKIFASKPAGQKEAKDIIADYKNKLDKVQDTYDVDTTHGAWVTPSMLPERKKSFQIKWKGSIEKARTTARPSAGVLQRTANLTRSGCSMY